MISIEPPVTLGRCTSEHFSAYFIPLVVVIMVATALAVFFAVKIIDVADALSDSKAISYAFMTHLQAWFVGISFLVALHSDDSTDATYLSRVLMIFVFSVTTICIVTFPKLYRVAFNKNSGDAPKSRVHITTDSMRISGRREKRKRPRKKDRNPSN